jgi:hypothetical protein
MDETLGPIISRLAPGAYLSHQRDPIDMLRQVPAFYVCDPSGAPFMHVEDEDEGERGSSRSWLSRFFMRGGRGEEQRQKRRLSRSTVRYYLSSMDAGEAVSDSLISAAAARAHGLSQGSPEDTDEVRLGVTSLAEVGAEMRSAAYHSACKQASMHIASTHACKHACCELAVPLGH